MMNPDLLSRALAMLAGVTQPGQGPMRRRKPPMANILPMNAPTPMRPTQPGVPWTRSSAPAGSAEQPQRPQPRSPWEY